MTKREGNLGVISADNTQAKTEIVEGNDPEVGRDNRLADTQDCYAIVGAIAPEIP